VREVASEHSIPLDAVPLIVEEATSTLSELTRAQALLTEAHKQLLQEGIQMTVWGPDLPTNGLKVSMINAEDSAADRIAGLADPVRVILQRSSSEPESASRTTDSSPWYAGDRIVGGGLACTSGFSMADWFGTQYMSAAGHCGDATWTQSGNTYGNTVGMLYPDGGNGDAQIIGAWPNSAAGRVYVTSGSSLPVKSYSASSTTGESGICVDGYVTGERCGRTVGQSSTCVWYPAENHVVCGLYELYSNSDNVQVCDHGDSGGPSYSYRPSDGFLNARGWISGFGTYGSTKMCYLTPVGVVHSGLGVLPMYG
jgi:hypothetical protein